ncbi:hypothetical protein V1514DRAFT_332975 [Lipomyces japonicus]|uniref:uncharacterized protein n=1 Tax=Lipomyces japonicus TaxID=56871 RepID=UPI0034CFA5DB
MAASRPVSATSRRSRSVASDSQLQAASSSRSSSNSNNSGGNNNNYNHHARTPSVTPSITPAPFDQAHLLGSLGAEGHRALLAHDKTLDLYRQNARRSQDPAVQFSFAQFLIQTVCSLVHHSQAQAEGQDIPRAASAVSSNASTVSSSTSIADDSTAAGTASGGTSATNTTARHDALLREAYAVLKRLADRSYPDAQYLLADALSSGLFHGRRDSREAFGLFVAATKHGHPESAFRAGLCYEEGWGTAKDVRKALQFYKAAAARNHVGAMLKLGIASFYNRLGIHHQQRDGIRWLNRASDAATEVFPQGPYELALIYEIGYLDLIIPDPAYVAQLFVKSADLGYAPAAARLGAAYEYAELTCPHDPALSVHYYTQAALAGDATSMLALCAWYMVGAENVLNRSEEEAFEWARRAADAGLPKAMYAVGHFYESGVGTHRDLLEANLWYTRAAEGGDYRAQARLKAIAEAPPPTPSTSFSHSASHLPRQPPATNTTLSITSSSSLPSHATPSPPRNQKASPNTLKREPNSRSESADCILM